MEFHGGPRGPRGFGGRGRGGMQKENVNARVALSDALEIEYIDPSSVKFEITEGNMLKYTHKDGTTHERVQLHRSFPFSCKDEYISVRTHDNNELGIIRSIKDFDDETIAILNIGLELRYFAPEITEIFSIKEEFGYMYWNVKTNKGNVSFTVRNGRGNIFFVSKSTVMINDVDGNRFIISDFEKTEEKHQKTIEMYL